MATQVVLAFFKDEPAADAAVESLKAWDKIDDEVKLSAIGVLALDEQGKVKTQKLGSRSITKGAGIGLLLALITPLGLGVVIAGAGFGALHHKGLGLKGEDRDRIAAELAGGKAAVGVLVKDARGGDRLREARRARRGPGDARDLRRGRGRGRCGRACDRSRGGPAGLISRGLSRRKFTGFPDRRWPGKPRPADPARIGAVGMPRLRSASTGRPVTCPTQWRNGP